MRVWEDRVVNQQPAKVSLCMSAEVTPCYIPCGHLREDPTLLP